MAREFKRQMFHKEVAKKSDDEDVYVIPDGKTLRLDRFSGGAEYSKKTVRVELIERDGSDTVIAAGYVGAGFQYAIDQDFVGDGTKAIVIKHYNDDSGKLWMSGWWEGVVY